MAKTKSQRMKEYRERKKQLLGDEWNRMERERMRASRVPVSQLSAQELEHKRALNRKHCAKFRMKRKLEKAKETNIDQQKCTSETDINGVSSTTDIAVGSPLKVKMNFNSCNQSSRRSRGRKRVSKALAKQYRKNEKLEEENESLRRRLNTTRKKLNRLEHKQKAEKTALTPNSKTDKLLQENGIDPSVATAVKQKLLFAECISEEIKEAAKVNDPDLLRPIISGERITKYRLKKRLSDCTGVNRRKLNVKKKLIEIKKRTRKEYINQTITRDIREFLERDDNSRLLPGKADAVKAGNSKIQKRVLNDYMYNLHNKFQAEASYKVSHSTFCRKKPLHIAHVNFSTRSVCLCQKHQNFALKLRCLKNYKATSITSPDKFMDTYNTDEALEVVLKGIESNSVRFQEWKRQKMKDGKEKMRVVDTELQKEAFIELMKQTYKDFANHIKKVVEQYKAVKQMKERLPENHVLVQMDFSENYSCQNLEEVQSAYWNATAVTLHPTVIYKRNADGSLEHQSVVFVSEVLHHNAPMVLVIIDKVVQIAKDLVGDLKGIHFWTDSPTSQYRNKTIFKYVDSLKTSHGLLSCSWSYFEAGHGKGPCDGIGGTTKRNADNAIKQGKVIIQDADDFFKWASGSDSQIKYLKINEEEYTESVQRVERESVKPIKGTMKIHSVVVDAPGCLRTRETTCACSDCFGDNGFSDSTLCLWTKQNLTLIKPKSKREDKDIANENESNIKANDNEVLNLDENDNQLPNTNTVTKFNTEWKQDDFVIVVYEKKCYVGQVTDIDTDDDEVEVKCMEECSKVEGRYRWPRKEDKIWLNSRNVIKVIETPIPTAKSKRMFSLDNTATLFMREYSADQAMDVSYY